MSRGTGAGVVIRRMRRGEGRRPRLVYAYRTRHHYALQLRAGGQGWRIDLTLRPLPRETEKRFESALFAPHIDDPMVFVARLGGRDVGWIELGYESWNNRLRVHELLVREALRRRGIGGKLLRKARSVAVERGARMVVLETQSCNVQAIAFYRSQGYELLGFDGGAYSNLDIARGEVRLEFALKLKPRKG